MQDRDQPRDTVEPTTAKPVERPASPAEGASDEKGPELATSEASTSAPTKWPSDQNLQASEPVTDCSAVEASAEAESEMSPGSEDWRLLLDEPWVPAASEHAQSGPEPELPSQDPVGFEADPYLTADQSETSLQAQSHELPPSLAGTEPAPPQAPEGEGAAPADPPGNQEGQARQDELELVEPVVEATFDAGRGPDAALPPDLGSVVPERTVGDGGEPTFWSYEETPALPLHPAADDLHQLSPPADEPVSPEEVLRITPEERQGTIRAEPVLPMRPASQASLGLPEGATRGLVEAQQALARVGSAASSATLYLPSEDARDRATEYLRSALRVAAWLAIALFALIFFLIVLYRWVNPPASALMLGQWLSGTAITQRWVPLESISPHLVRAVVASEDARFCSHWGVDWGEIGVAIDRARDGIPRGGSTISMQVAKNLFLWPSRSYLRKTIEIPLTYVIEAVWPKRRVIEVYLNIAEWGPGIFGAEAAARRHFRRPASLLTPWQAALLAVSLPNPIERTAGSPGPGTIRLAHRLVPRIGASQESVRCLGLGPRRWGRPIVSGH